MSLCEENRARFYGPLDGSFHVTDKKLTPFLTYDAALRIAEDAKVVQSVAAVKEYTVFLSGLDYIGKNTFMRDRYSGEPVPYGQPVPYTKGFQLVGVTSMDILKEVYADELTILEGTAITEQNNSLHHNKIVISDEVAEQNGLTIGDTVILDMDSLYRAEREIAGLAESSEKSAASYIVGGIYCRKNDNSAGVAKPWQVHGNRVYVPISTLSDIAKSSYITESYQTDGFFALKEDPIVVPDSLYFRLSDREEAAALEREINEIGFKNTVLLTEYVSDAASSPSARLAEILSVILACIIGMGLVILLLATLFSMKARHRELAVLAALGQKRSRIAWSFFTEIALLMLCALFFGGLFSSALTVLFAAPIKEYLYAAEYAAQFQNETLEGILEGAASADIANSTGSVGKLLTLYCLPSFAFASAAGALLLAVLYFFVKGYVKRINALSDVGGKE